MHVRLQGYSYWVICSKYLFKDVASDTSDERDGNDVAVMLPGGQQEPAKSTGESKTQHAWLIIAALTGPCYAPPSF